MMKEFDENYVLLEEMEKDSYFPDFLVEEVRETLRPVIRLLEGGERDTEVIQEKLDEAVRAINDLEEAFEENDSEIETSARESIAATVRYILDWFGVEIDTETAIREREW